MRYSLRSGVVSAIAILGSLATSLLLPACSSRASSADPAFSPESSKIIFDSSRGGNQDIWVMNADGSDPTNLTNDANQERTPVWSPDGKKIAFQSFGPNGVGNIWVMNADGSNPTNLTKNLTNDNSPGGAPAWSPDGKKIAFESFQTGVTKGTDFKQTDIGVMDADGSNQTNLTNDPANDTNPAWSPDSTKIAFTSDRGGDTHIWVMNADGSNPINLTNGNEAWEGGPAWSPDGSKIAFARGPKDGTRSPDIWTMNADGSNPINLTNHNGFAGDYDPAWSPDGKKIAFNWNQNYITQIWVMNADGNNVTKLTR